MIRPQSLDDVTLLRGQALSVPFDLGGFALVPGWIGELAEPMESCLKLFAEKPREALRLIDSPDDLSEIVERISGPLEALEFVRLFTDATTFHFFTRTADCIECRVIADSAPVGVATLAASRASELGVSPVRVAPADDGFVVERALVCAATLTGARSLRSRVETVSANGRYALLSDTPIATLTSAEVRMPHHE